MNTQKRSTTFDYLKILIMKILTKASSILLMLLVAFTLQAQNTQTANFIPGQLLIKLKESAKTQKTALSTQMKATSLKSYPTLGIDLWEIKQNTPNGKQATLALIEQYKNHPDVEFVEPNYLWEAIGGTEPNDPYFPQLWGLHNTGQNGGTEDADIDAPEAYCMAISYLDVVVGIVDTGIDYTHEDLAENMWNNLGEDADGDGKVLIKSGNTWIFDPGDENGIDDDGNGYIDDFVGWDFVYNDNDPMDLQSHGTHCAGTIGAVTNNETGINGVAPNAKLAALKFLNDNGSGSTADAVDAINYAVAMGIPITNNSWGGGPFSAALYQAIQNAEANNHLFIAAAGNYNLDNDKYKFYPASYDNDNVFSVASTDKTDNKSSFSHYGLTTVDIGAPGSQIYSCIPNNGYGNKSGTSMATPHIAGVCAFVLGANPGSNYSTIKNALINSVDPLTGLNGKCVSGGRVNLHDALVEMGAPANPCDDICEFPECDDCEAPPCDPPTCNRLTDSLALIALYNATDGPNWTTTWELNQPMDNWHGVGLNQDGCVTHLNLDNNRLNGDISSEIGSLTALTYFRLSNNQLIGEIPREIGDLVNLINLELYANQLTGNIPNELGNLIRLKRLNLEGNQITENIPNEIGSLANLEFLNLQRNQLNGPIPSSLYNLNELEYLTLWDNQLSGNISDEIGNLIKLTHLSLHKNDFTGLIPMELGNLINLKKLSIGENELSGDIPLELGNLTNLTRLSISSSQLSGNIPTTFGNLQNLTYLSVGFSNLNGNIPAELGNLNNLLHLHTYYNQLSGCYHPNLQNLCNQLITANIDSNNNFDAPWEDFCATGAGSCGPAFSQVWPGDFDNNGIAEINDLLYWGAAYNSTGVTRPSATTNWVGQDCEDWSSEVNGINSKHQDGNGDGVVNNADITALTQNLGQTHSFTAPNGLSSTMQFNLTPNFAANNTNSNNTFEYDFFVEDDGNTVSAHGVSASIFFGALNVVSATIDVNGSVLNPQEYLQNFDAANNTLHFSLTKTNGSNSTLNGSVCKIVVGVLEIEGGESFALNLNSGGVMQANGTMHEVSGTTVYDTYYENGASTNTLALNASASHASCENGGSALVNAFGGNGNYCYEWNTGASTQQITDLSPGMYSVLVCDDNGVANSIDVEVQGQFIPIYDDNGDIIPCNTFATCPTIIDFEGYVPDGTHQAKSAIHTKADLENGYNVELKASNLIRLTSGFSTRGSQSFKVRMENCE